MSTREDVSASLKQRGISSIYRDESGENFGLDTEKTAIGFLWEESTIKMMGYFLTWILLLKLSPPIQSDLL